MINTTEEHSANIETTAFPTFTALCRKLVALRAMMRPFLRRSRWGLILIAVFAAILITGNWWEEVRTRPTRELYTALAQKMVTIENIDRNMRSYRTFPLFKRFISQRDEVSDTVNLMFYNTQITRETMELCCRLRSISGLNFFRQEIHPQDLQPFSAHPEIKSLSFGECSLSEEQLAAILKSFPNLVWIHLNKTPLTDKSVDLLIARKIILTIPTGQTLISPAATAKLRAAKLGQ